VGHEYFHNWTGNRVTCRDWFQLSLKEGLTVFRDQEFSQDLAGEASARAVKRIEDVRVLRTAQFPEDAGPMAHPVRPDQYLEINNFYTVTVYEKGAEVVRMMQTLVGREGFAKGISLYFQRFDGQAVTCDDFAQAIADANPESQLAQLLPSSSAGTARPARRACRARPLRRRLRHLHADAVAKLPPTPGQPTKALRDPDGLLGLLDAAGRELTSGMHVLTQASETLTFPGSPRAGAFAAARLQRAGDPGVRLQRRPAAGAAGARHRPVQPLGSRAAPGHRNRALAFIRGAGGGSLQLDAPTSTRCAACCATRSWTPPSRSWC
jgi:aminopeptidase N